jgi:hypothetical protein
MWSVVAEGRRRTGGVRRGTWARRLGVVVVAGLYAALIQVPASASAAVGSPVATICNPDHVWAPSSPVTIDATCSSYDASHRLTFQWDYDYNGTMFTPSVDSHGFAVSGLMVTMQDGFTWAARRPASFTRWPSRSPTSRRGCPAW